jgi:hypothetical protein
LFLQVGRLWCALADFYVRQGLFERARDVYQEGIESVVTVRDFGLIFTALTSFEEALVEAQIAEGGDEERDAAAADDDGADFLLMDDGRDIDLRLDRLEWLLARRPLLLNSVMLRQNPHNVQACPRFVALASVGIYALDGVLRCASPCVMALFTVKWLWRGMKDCRRSTMDIAVCFHDAPWARLRVSVAKAQTSSTHDGGNIDQRLWCCSPGSLSFFLMQFRSAFSKASTLVT